MSRRNRNLKYRYGIDENDYDIIYNEQDGICPICGLPIDKSEGNIDHDHRTGKVRGILHPNCNTGLGKLDDDVQKLDNAIQYLNKYL